MKNPGKERVSRFEGGRSFKGGKLLLMSARMAFPPGNGYVRMSANAWARQ